MSQRGLDFGDLQEGPLAMRKLGGFFLEGEQRHQAWVGPLECPSSTMPSIRPKSDIVQQSSGGVWQRLRRSFPGDISACCVLTDANHTHHLASEQLKQANRD